MKKYRIVKLTNEYGNEVYIIEKRWLWIFWEGVVDYYDVLLPVTKRFHSKESAEWYIRTTLCKYNKREIV